MKLNKLVLTLSAAALLPSFAYAGTDTVAASFERDMNRTSVNYTTTITGEADALTTEFNIALNGTGDAVLASFERDLYRTPVNTMVAVAGETDALTTEFSIALNGTGDAVLASFERDLYRTPVNTMVAIAGEADKLTVEFNAALRDTINKPVMQAAVANKHRLGS